MKNNINVLFNLSAQELKNFMTHLSVRTHEPYLYFFDVIKNCDNLSCQYACECDTISHKLADPEDGYLYFLKYNRTKKVKRINNAAASYIALARIWNKFIQSDKPEDLDCILYTSNTKFIDIFNDIIAGFMIQARMNEVYSGNYRGVQVLGIMESLKDQDLDKFYDETFTWVREKWGVNKRPYVDVVKTLPLFMERLEKRLGCKEEWWNSFKYLVANSTKEEEVISFNDMLKKQKDDFLYIVYFQNNIHKETIIVPNAAVAYQLVWNAYNNYNSGLSRTEAWLYTDNLEFMSLMNEDIAAAQTEWNRLKGFHSDEDSECGIEVKSFKSFKKWMPGPCEKLGLDKYESKRGPYSNKKKELKWKRKWNVKFQSIKDFVKITFDQKNLKVYIELNCDHSDSCEVRKIHDEISKKLENNHIYTQWCCWPDQVGNPDSKWHRAWGIQLGFNANESIKDEDRYLISVPDYVKSKNIDLENIEVESIEFDISALK